MNRHQVVGVVGAAVLFVSSLLPFGRNPFVWHGGVGSLFALGQGWMVAGTMLMCLAALSTVLNLYRKYRWLWLTAAASGVALVLSVLSIVTRVSWGLSWGFGVAVTGTLLLATAAAIKEK